MVGGISDLFSYLFSETDKFIILLLSLAWPMSGK